jgi:hypothetical protein
MSPKATAGRESASCRSEESCENLGKSTSAVVSRPGDFGQAGIVEGNCSLPYGSSLSIATVRGLRPKFTERDCIVVQHILQG